jgi:hypothetical protein
MINNNGINKLILYLQGTLLTVLISLMLLIQPKANAQEPNWPKPPYSVEQLRASHKSMESIWPWLGQPEHRLHLRDEKHYELLLAIEGYARGGTYILFAERNGKWSQISDKIEQAHHPVHILKTTNDGWHNFETFVPLWGSGGEVFVSTYSWNGEKYILTKSESGKWCDYEPFKGDIHECPAR